MQYTTSVIMIVTACKDAGTNPSRCLTTLVGITCKQAYELVPELAETAQQCKAVLNDDYFQYAKKVLELAF